MLVCRHGRQERNRDRFQPHIRDDKAAESDVTHNILYVKVLKSISEQPARSFPQAGSAAFFRLLLVYRYLASVLISCFWTFQPSWWAVPVLF
jgi:hypothetical protein